MVAKKLFQAMCASVVVAYVAIWYALFDVQRLQVSIGAGVCGLALLTAVIFFMWALSAVESNVEP